MATDRSSGKESMKTGGHQSKEEKKGRFGLSKITQKRTLNLHKTAKSQKSESAGASLENGNEGEFVEQLAQQRKAEKAKKRIEIALHFTDILETPVMAASDVSVQPDEVGY